MQSLTEKNAQLRPSIKSCLLEDGPSPWIAADEVNFIKDMVYSFFISVVYNHVKCAVMCKILAQLLLEAPHRVPFSFACLNRF